MIQELIDIILEVASGLLTTAGVGRVKGFIFKENKASGRFLTIRVLEESAGKRLINTVTENIYRTGLKGFQIYHQLKKIR